MASGCVTGRNNNWRGEAPVVGYPAQFVTAPMDPETRQRLSEMLQEVRGWTLPPDGAVDHLATRHGLNPLMVRRILEAEFGIQPPGQGDPQDPDGSEKRTLEMRAIEED